MTVCVRLFSRSLAIPVALAGTLGVGCAAALDDTTAGPAVDPDAEGTPMFELAPHWDALAARADGPLAVRWGMHGTPTSVYGMLAGARTGAGVSDAWAFVADRRGVLGLAGGLGELDGGDRVESPLGAHVGFSQRYQGVPVDGAEVKVHFNRDGQVIALTNTTVPRLALDPRPRLTADAALATALAAAPARTDDDDEVVAPVLVISAAAGAPRLAYKVIVPAGGATLRMFVDAHTGALLAPPADLNRYVNGTGQVFKDNAVVATQNNNLVDGNDAASAVPSTAYSVVTLQGLAGTNRLDGTFASGSQTRSRALGTNNNFLFLRNTVAFSETMAYFHIDFAQRYIQSLGFTNVNNRQQVYSVDRSTADNSSYSPSTKRITYGTGGVDDAEDGEVIIHEYGHSVQDNQVPGFGATLEGGSMGEGFGDYLAATVNAALAGSFQIECVAEWDAVSYASGVPHCLRRLDSTKHYPQAVVGEVHADGEMWSASLFQIRTALGAARADKVILQAHFLLTSSANFKDGANALVTAAINLGYTATEVSTIRTILQNRGFTVTA